MHSKRHYLKFFTLVALVAFIYTMSGAPKVYATSISVDTTVKVDGGTATSGSLSMTIASGASLWVCVPGANTKAVPTSVTWNTSESLTLAASHVPAAAFVDNSIWYLANPTSGTHNITVTFSGSHEFDITAISLLGTAASPLGAVSSGADGVNTSFSDSVTTTAANSWVLGCGTINGDTSVTTVTHTGSGQVNQIALNHTSSSGWQTEVDSIPATTAATYTLSFGIAPSRNYDHIAVEVLAAAAAPATPSNFGSLIFFGW